MKNEESTETLNTAAICERLKTVRVHVCGTRGQSHFAALLHLSPSTYNYYEKGRIPPVDVLDRASRLTGAPLLWLIRGEPSDFDLNSLKRIETPGNASNAQSNGVHTAEHAGSGTAGPGGAA
jgi:transcriptional regulator with XRE-family HTH domain